MLARSAQDAQFKVRYLAAEIAILRQRSGNAPVRGGDMLADADRMEREAKALCALHNLGDWRYV